MEKGKQKQGNYRNFIPATVTKGYNVQLSVIAFQEDDVFFIYCPALDCSGYENNESEAQTSFELTLEEYFKYTTNKNTSNFS